MQEIRSRAMSRHPLAFGLVFALCAVSIFELLQPPNPAVLAEIPELVLRTQNWLIVLSTVLILLGAVLHAKSPVIAVHFELAGMCGFACVMASYVVLLRDAAPEFWGAWMQSSILTAAFLLRASQLVKMLRAMIRITKHLDELGDAIHRLRRQRRLREQL